MEEDDKKITVHVRGIHSATWSSKKVSLDDKIIDALEQPPDPKSVKALHNGQAVDIQLTFREANVKHGDRFWLDPSTSD